LFFLFFGVNTVSPFLFSNKEDKNSSPSDSSHQNVDDIRLSVNRYDGNSGAGITGGNGGDAPGTRRKPEVVETVSGVREVMLVKLKGQGVHNQLSLNW